MRVCDRVGMRRPVLLLAAVLALLAPSAALAGRGERPDLSPTAGDQALAKRLGLHVTDLSRSIRWRRHPNPWFLDYDCSGAPDESGIVMTGEWSLPLYGGSFVVNSTVHVLQSQDHAVAESRLWTRPAALACLVIRPSLPILGGYHPKIVSRQRLPLEKAHLAPRLRAYRQIMRYASPRDTFYEFEDFVLAGDGRVNIFLQMMQTTRTRSPGDVKQVSENMLDTLALLVDRLQRTLRSS
jgi:hypothetical protein